MAVEVQVTRQGLDFGDRTSALSIRSCRLSSPRRMASFCPSRGVRRLLAKLRSRVVHLIYSVGVRTEENTFKSDTKGNISQLESDTHITNGVGVKTERNALTQKLSVDVTVCAPAAKPDAAHATNLGVGERCAIQGDGRASESLPDEDFLLLCERLLLQILSVCVPSGSLVRTHTTLHEVASLQSAKSY